MPIKAIARRLGISRNTVRSALASVGPPKYQRSAKGSAVDEFEPRIRAMLAEFQDMPATVFAERGGLDLVDHGVPAAGHPAEATDHA